MKITMVIADDEPVALKSEELFIKKEFPEIEITGMAENGIALRQILKEKKPDIAIVDIRMPGLSGIEVIELMQAEDCDTHFIIHTAYSDFDYAKRALDLKVDGYLLKPGKREESKEVIRKVCQAVVDEREAHHRQTRLQSALVSASPAFGREVLLSIFSEDCDEEGFALYCSMKKISFSGGCIATFLSREPKAIGSRDLDGALADVLEGHCEFMATITSHGVVVMLFVPQELGHTEQEYWCEDMAAAVAKHLEETMGVAYYLGVGDIYETFSQMRDSYRDSIQKFHIAGNRPGVPNENADKSETYVARAKQYVSQNFRKDISLSDCAQDVGISPYYLSHIFKERTSCTFVEYLSAIRIEEAKKLALNRNLTINDIAEQCGYLNITYFCKVFKRLTGKTIGEYRRQEFVNR